MRAEPNRRLPMVALPFAMMLRLLLLQPDPPPAAPKADSFGDPLPRGTITRIGTIRFRHSGPIYSLAFSPDGTRLTSAAWGGVSVWEAHSGRPLAYAAMRWNRPGPAISADGSL